MSFNELGLSAELLRAVAEQGYSTPTPIQRQAIPVILQGRDIMAGAQTGTGKTAGFTLPLLHKLQAKTFTDGSRPIRALVLTPTRELAAQVEESVRNYGRYLPLQSAAIFGGVNINPQFKILRRGVDILVATPGRLMDHVQQRTISLSKIEILILDEADRMLDMGFMPQLRKILALLPKARQNLMFSATFPEEIRKLANEILRSPVQVEVARSGPSAEGITQQVYPVEQTRKRELLSYLIGSNNWQQVLVFIRTKHAADRLAKQLIADGLQTAAIHGNKSQGARTRALADFKSGAVRVLVATDIAARGLDIDQLPHVVNYDLPNVSEDYVHRIGRTGRAGSTGTALSLVSGEDRGLLRDIERLIKREIPRIVLPGYDIPQPRSATNDSRPRSDRPQHRKPGQPQQRTQRGDSRGNQPRTDRARPGNGANNPNNNGNGKPRRNQNDSRGRQAEGRGNDSRKSAEPYSAAGRPQRNNSQQKSRRAPQGQGRRETPALFGSGR
jgi:ATP-dependent RNA helicase RhlE